MHRQSQEQEQDQEQERVVVVTGSSSGIGYTTSLMLIRNGFYSYATMRSLEKFTSIRAVANKERVLPQQAIKPDVNDDLSVKITIEKIKSEKGRIDILVNNAGYGLIGSVGDISVGDKSTIRNQFVWSNKSNAAGISNNEETKRMQINKYKFHLEVYLDFLLVQPIAAPSLH